MYELVKLGEKTYFVDCPTRIGIYRINDTDVCLIDSGNNPDAGKKVLKICEDMGWSITYIINTHAHADHNGGNAVIQKRTGCRILANKRDLCQINHPRLNNCCTFGARTPAELDNKFMLADESKAEQITSENIPHGLTFAEYPGHSFDQIAVMCDDGTLFTGDILCGAKTIEKYHIFFIRDPEEYASSAKALCECRAEVYCAAHYPPIYSNKELCELADMNLAKLQEIFGVIRGICNEPKCFEQILKETLDHYSLELSFNQYAIAGSTIRGMLSYLHDKGEIDTLFRDNYLLWQTK
ncbi:MAG: MBL fold metallo-hydrolase [Ruminococcaceae bacterium]|nr:MBL fold metallo-hydrolase [Oscillospiraceae bacterium]